MGRVRPHVLRGFRSPGRLLLALFALAVPSPALARTARVPEDFSTIQAAVDYLVQFRAADTVLVQAGYYPERVMTHKAVCIIGVPAPGSAEPLTRIDGLEVHPPSDGSIINVIGIHVAGPALTAPSSGPDNVNYESCRFDAGMEGYGYYPDLASVVMRHCTLYGGIALCAVETVVDSCTVYGPLSLLAVGDAVVTDSRFENVQGFAASVFSDQRAYVARNVVRGGVNGFDVRTGDQNDIRVEDNWIEGCAGIGIRVWHDWRNNAQVERNQVLRCGGTGIYARGLSRARGNRVLDCGGHGLDLVVLEDVGLAEGNVVGRCGGDGIRLQRDYDQAPTFHAQGNTVFECAGSGFVAAGLTGGLVSNNIAFRNHAYGLLIAGSGTATVSCNDWFENQAGATSGAPVSTSDLAVDPLFCGLAADDVQLRSDSPLLAAPGCGQIGALGVGCEPPPVVIELELKQDVLPAGAHGGWVTAWLEPRAPFAASDVDIASVRLNGVPAASDGHIGDRDRDGISDLQLRFDREAVGQTLGRGAVATVTVTGTMRGRQLIGTDAVRIPHGQSIHRPSDLDPEASAPVLAIGAPITNGIGGRLRVAFSLADAGPARLDVLDVAGRVVLSQDVGGAGPGAHTMELGDRGRLAQGIYFLRIRQGASEARTRAAIVR